MKNRGFTLVELLGVILILALLSLVMFPNIISSFFDVSNKLDNATKTLIIEADKDYYLENRDNFVNLDYCVTVCNLQAEGLLSDIIVKISEHGKKYELDGQCIVTADEIKNAALAYYNNGNIAIGNGESRCITILTLQNAYYLSKNISNGTTMYNTNTSLKLTNNGWVTVDINESC